ncbi:MAG TPA: response regulator [Acidocella sp.]|nr:response regulator [Acidocella sp.]
MTINAPRPHDSNISLAPPSSLMIAHHALIAEDDPMICMLLTEMLMEMGHTVCAAVATHDDAVIQAAKLKPDLMIVDAGLRGGSGVDAMTKILAIGFIPHLFMSGNIAKVRMQRPDAIMLEKPFNELALTQALQRALRTKLNA